MHTVGRYEITGELGRGAMGMVYTAIDPVIGRTVALKTMRPDVHGIEADEALSRFRNEARAAGTLSHPNIVTIFDAGVDEGTFYIAMEHLEGETLAQILGSRRPSGVDWVINIARQVAAALDYAHARGIIHRDVKPANISVARDGSVKIMDFGISKSNGNMTLPGQVMGTPNYMSPEQVVGKPVDGRSDLFSLAAIVYEMLTCHKPFSADQVTTIIYKIVHEEPTDPRELDISIHPGLNAVVKRALSKHPDDRYATGADFVRELENYKSFASDEQGTSSGDETFIGGAFSFEAQLEAALAPTEPAPVVSAADATIVEMKVVSMQGREQYPAEAEERTALQPPIPIEAHRPTLPRKHTAPWLAAVAIIVTLVVGTFGGLAIMRWMNLRHAAAATPPLVPVLAPEAEASALNPAEPAVTWELPVRDIRAKGRTGKLRLESTPPGAVVRIDGRASDQWTTPFTAVNVKAGKHVVSAWLDGAHSQKMTVNVVAGKETTLHFTLPAPRAGARGSAFPDVEARAR